jgi:hypothetical protein
MRLFLRLVVVFGLAFVLGLSVAGQVSPNQKPTTTKRPADSQERNNESKTAPAITPSSFGFQCGPGRATNCPNATWPNTVAQPGMIRLWDSQVQWHVLNVGPGSYNWRALDAYLDAIAAHQPRDVMYTFGYTPCWDTKGVCERGWGSTYPPDDLSPNGSPSFNTFVTALVDHCSSAGHCVKDFIKYWELWNEANAENYWNGTVSQLYQLMAPAVPIIRSKVTGASILTPPANRGDTAWMRNWLEEENKKGRLSDIFSFHLYLQGATPETRFETVQQMVALKKSTPGWSTTPWVNSETNFDAGKFACSDKYGTDDCIGQMVRWHLLHYGAGAQQLSWYFFNTTIGRNSDFASAYHTMMQWLVGGHFLAECSANGSVYTCPFLEANSHHALFVWAAGGESSYAPAAQYVNYKTLGGNSAAISQGQKIPIGVKPIMIEGPN